MEPIDIGMQVARAEFKRRGNHAEAHLSEAELAALISIGVERAQEQAKAKIAEIEAKLQTAAPDLVDALRWSQAMLRTLMDAVAPAARSSFLAGLADNEAALEKAGVKS